MHRPSVFILAIAATLCACGGDHGAAALDAGATSPDGTAPPGPTLTASPGESAARLSWTAVAGATSYNVYRADARGTQGALLQSADATRLDDTTVTNFAPYWYEVTAVVGGAETAPSNQANAFGYDLAHWTQRHSGLPLTALAYAPGSVSATGHDVYVAIGSNGRLLTSADGTAWAGVIGVPAFQLDAVTYGAGLFVAVGWDSAGTHSIFTSPDGQAWTPRDAHSPAVLWGVTYAQSGSLVSPVKTFVAVGDSGTIVTSHDGVTWTATSCGTSSLRTVAVSEHAVAPLVQAAFLVAGGANKICYSTDAVAWTALANPLPVTPFYVASVADDTTRSVWLLDQTGAVLEVPYDDAAHGLGTLQSGTLPVLAPGAGYVGIAAYTDAASARHVVSLGSAGQLVDTTAPSPAIFHPLAATITGTLAASALYATALAAVGKNLFVLGATEQILRSTDGGATLAVLRDDPGGSNYSIATRDGLAVIDHGDGAVLTSTDTATFTPGTTGAPFLNALSLATTPSGFSLVYVDGLAGALQLYETADAQAWTKTVIPLSLCAGCSPQADGAVLWTGSGYAISVAEYLAPNATALSVTGSPAAGFQSAPQSPNLLVAQMWQRGTTLYALTEEVILQSNDGVTWSTSSTLPPAFTATAYLDTGSVAYVANLRGQISRSTDGVSWSPPIQIDPQQRIVTKLVRFGDHVVAIGTDGLLTASTDGVTWTAIPTESRTYYTGAAVTDHGFVVVGTNDVVLTAP